MKRDINNELIKAIEADNSAQVIDLLRRGANPNATTYYGRFALTIAAGRGNYEITKLLLDSGSYVNVLNPSRWTALRVAAQKGNSKIVRLLIDNGATLDSIDDFSIVSPKIAAVLLKYKKKLTDLFFERVSEYKKLDIARFLVLYGVDINFTDEQGVTPIVQAAAKGYANLVEFLAAAGANAESLEDVNVKKILQEAADKKKRAEKRAERERKRQMQNLPKVETRMEKLMKRITNAAGG